jgi:hypothetical protein
LCRVRVEVGYGISAAVRRRVSIARLKMTIAIGGDPWYWASGIKVGIDGMLLSGLRSRN